jgi:aminoglycoside 6'-N-acetyltransferase I
MEIREIRAEDLADVSALASELWPHAKTAELNGEFLDMLASSEHKVYICREGGEAAGFAHISLRHDYVDHASSSPVGYLEGIYVRKAYRKKGAARDLLARGEAWAKSMGCREFASDCLLGNTLSLKFHLKTGFRLTNKIVCFLKNL